MKIITHFGNTAIWGECEGNCDECPWRFKCYTTRTDRWLVLENIEPTKTIVIGAELQGYYLMQCPYCNRIFAINEHQYNYNLKFMCHYCRKFNHGSRQIDERGVLIGNPSWVGSAVWK